MKKKVLSFLIILVSVFYSHTSMGVTTNDININQDIQKVLKLSDLVGKEFIIDTENYKDKKITIGFTKNRIYGFGGANRYFAIYKLEKNRLIIDTFGSTKVASKKENELAELIFFTALKDNKEVLLEGPYLYLNSSNDSNFKFRDLNYQEENIIKINY